MADDFSRTVEKTKLKLIKAWSCAKKETHVSEETVDVSCELGGPDHTATESQRRDDIAVVAGMDIVDSRCAGAGEIDNSTEIVGVVQYVTSENELADNESMLDCMYEQSAHNSVVQTCTPLPSGQIWADLKADIKTADSGRCFENICLDKGTSCVMCMERWEYVSCGFLVHK